MFVKCDSATREGMATMKKKRRIMGGVLTSVVLAVMLTGGKALSATIEWLGPEGEFNEWSVTNNWPGGTLPVTNDVVNIRYGRKAVVGTGTVVDGATLYVANGNNKTGTLRLDGGLLTNVLMYVGNGNSTAVNTGCMEIVSGAYVSSNALILGNSSGHAWVTMTGGLVSNRNVVLSGKLSRFVQSGGTNMAGPYPSTGGQGAFEIWSNAGAYSEYVLEGGTLRVMAGDQPVLYCRGNLGSLSRLRVSGDSQLIVPGGIFFPIDSFGRGEGYFTRYTNTLPVINIANGGNNRHSYTGIVSIVECDVKVPGFNVAGGNSNSHARILVDGGRLWVSNELSLCANTDIPLGKRAILSLTNSATLLVSLTEDVTASASRDLFVGNGGELLICGGTVLIADRFRMRAGGRFEMTDGVFRPKRVCSEGSALTTPGIFYMKGGLFCPSGSCLIGGDENTAGTSYSQVPVTFIQTGGVVSNSALVLARDSTNAVSRYEISGGALAPNLTFQINVPGVSELCVKGSAPDLTMSYINDPNARSFLLECVLDKSLGHLAPMRFTSSAGYRCGHLRARLDGGVLLSATDTFTVMKKLSGTFTAARNYLSVPDAGLWTTSLVAGATESAITLAGKQAELVMHGTQSASFAAVPMGHVTVGNVATNFLVELIIRLRATAADGSELAPESLAVLASDLVGAGYTNSAAETSGIYNLKVSIPQEYVVPGNAFFAWDFTRTAGVKMIGTVTTNALVNAVRVEAVKTVGKGTVIFVL